MTSKHHLQSILYKELYIATVDVEFCTVIGVPQIHKRHLIIRADCHDEAVAIARSMVGKLQDHRVARVRNLAEGQLDLAPDGDVPWYFAMWVDHKWQGGDNDE